MEKRKKFKDSGIYYYRNKINGKLYIGQTQSLKIRRNEFLSYKKYAGPVIDRARQKYGVNNFEYGVLTHCSIDELDHYEMFYIKRLNTKIPNGYNMTDGGEGFRGGVWTEEQRKACSERNIGAGNPNYGHKWTDEQKKRASDFMKNIAKKGILPFYHTPEIIKKVEDIMFYKKYGMTIEDADKLILDFVETNKTTRYIDITKKLGFTYGFLRKSFKRLGLINELSETKNKIVVQCDKNNHEHVLNIFPSLKVARNKTGIKTISYCLKGNIKSTGGYFWRFGEIGEKPYDQYNEKWLKPLNGNAFDKYDKFVTDRGIIRKIVYCFNKNGEIIDSCNGLCDASKKYNISESVISTICNAQNCHFINGVTFSYNKDLIVVIPRVKKYVQYSLNGDVLRVYDTVKEIVSKTGFSKSSVEACISGKQKTSHGFAWKMEMLPEV